MFWIRPLLANRLEHLTRNGVGWLSGDVTLKNLLFGFAAGYCLLFTTQRFTGRSKYFGKVRQVIGFVGFYFWELILANLRVAYDVTTPRLEYLTDAAIWPAPARLRHEL